MSRVQFRTAKNKSRPDLRKCPLSSAHKALLFILIALPGSPVLAQQSETIGLVVSSKKLGVYETPFMDECPAGLAVGNDEYWWRSLTPEQREELTLGGKREVANAVRQDLAMSRGPNDEQICHFPESVQDPPLRIIEGKISYGLDLDGIDGMGSASESCPHQDFVSPDGEPGIDNQLYRLLGCSAGWRSSGFLSQTSDDDRKSSGLGLVLIEITNVDDRLNDDDVDVHIYRGIDPHRLDSAGRVLPYSTYRIDADNNQARYASSAKGRIVDGVLLTEPADVYIPQYTIVTFIRQSLRGMKMKIALPGTDGRGEGLIAGYADINQFWDYMRGIGGLAATGQFSCPGIYDAMFELADAFPDPETGQCTGISAAYTIEVVPAFIDKPEIQIGSVKVDGR